MYPGDWHKFVEDLLIKNDFAEAYVVLRGYSNSVHLYTHDGAWQDISCDSRIIEKAMQGGGVQISLEINGKSVAKAVMCSADDFRDTRKAIAKDTFSFITIRELNDLISLLSASDLTHVLMRISEFARNVAKDLNLSETETIYSLDRDDIALKAVRSGIFVLQSIAACYGGNLPEATIFLNSVSRKLSVSEMWRRNREAMSDRAACKLV